MMGKIHPPFATVYDVTKFHSFISLFNAEVMSSPRRFQLPVFVCSVTDHSQNGQVMRSVFFLLIRKYSPLIIFNFVIKIRVIVIIFYVPIFQY